MMKNKVISIPEIVDLMIKGRDISRDIAEEYIRVLLSSIEDALIEGETVKIKGLGYFRNVWNDKSNQLVDDKGIIVSGFYQVAFIPQDSFKDEINEPFSHLESVKVKINDVDKVPSDSEKTEESEEPFRLFEEQATEIKDLLKEIDELSVKTEKELKEIKLENKSEENKKRTIETIETFQDKESKSPDNKNINSESNKNKEITEQKFELEDFNIKRRIYEDYPEINKKKTEEQHVEVEEVKEESRTEEKNDIKRINEPEKNKTEVVSSTENTDKVKIDSSLEKKVESEDNNKIQTAVICEANEKKEMTHGAKQLNNEIYNEKKDIKKSKRFHWLLYIVITLFTIVVIIALVYFFTLIKKDKQIKKEKERIERIADSVAHDKRIKELQDSIMRMNRHVNNDLEDETSDDLTSTLNSLDENQGNSDLAESTNIDIFNEPRTYNKFIGKEKMTVGSKLTKFAQNYYGHADFWVYIYEANKDKINNPDNVPAGIELDIPEIDQRLIDVKNPEAINYAKKLQRKYLNH